MKATLIRRVDGSTPGTGRLTVRVEGTFFWPEANRAAQELARDLTDGSVGTLRVYQRRIGKGRDASFLPSWTVTVDFDGATR